MDSRGFEEFRGRALLDYCSTAVLDRDFTPRMLLEVLQREKLTKYLQRRLALAAWTRAVLIGENDTAVELAPLVAELAPELRSDLDAIVAAPTGEPRRFATALTLLRFPGAQPDLRSPVGRLTPIGVVDCLRDNWWCPRRPLTAAEAEQWAFLQPGPPCGSEWSGPVTLKNPPPPGFLTAGQHAEAAEMREKLQALEPAATYLGRTVLEWAKAHPHDERVPEALHRLVQAAHLGCPVQDGGTVAKTAFQLLHRRYPDSPWAAKTKFWYR